MTTEPIDLDAVQALADAATPGPWDHATKTYDGGPLVVAEGYGFPAEPLPAAGGIVCYPDADAAFIAQARTLVPALIAELRETRGRLTRMTESNNAWATRAKAVNPY